MHIFLLMLIQFASLESGNRTACSDVIPHSCSNLMSLRRWCDMPRWVTYWCTAIYLTKSTFVGAKTNRGYRDSSEHHAELNQSLPSRTSSILPSSSFDITGPNSAKTSSQFSRNENSFSCSSSQEPRASLAAGECRRRRPPRSLQEPQRCLRHRSVC